MNSLGLLDTFWQDLRYGARVFARDPGFTAVAVLTLALGIGGVTVIYSVIRNILLDPFPYTDSRRMVDVFVYDTPTGDWRGTMTSDEVLDYQEQSDVFEDVIGTISARGMIMPGREGAVLFSVSQVTPNAFDFLGVRPLLGRGILPSDGAPAAPPIVVLAHKSWVADFGAAPDVLGRPITLDGEARTIVGVMPPRFTWHVADAWIPRPLRRTDPERAFWLQARVKPGVSLEQAEAQLNVIASRRAQQHPDDYPEQFHIGVVTVIDFVVGRFRGVLYTLFAAVGLLLLIACCNVANMLLARGTARERELTVRAAIGASRARIIRQLMVESLLLALAGAAAGCLVAYAGIKAVAYFLPHQNVPYEVVLRLESTALMVCLATAIATALLFGLLPAWYGARRDLVQGLKEGGKGTGAAFRHGWVRNGLVIGEVALSLVLLLGAGLLMRGLLSVIRVDLGFTPSKLVMAQVLFPEGAYTSPEARHQYYRDAEARLDALPGVDAAGVNSSWPLGGLSTAIERPGLSVPEPNEAAVNLSSGGYLDALEMETVRGRALSAADVDGARTVAVVNGTFVDRYFGSEDPLGKLVRLPRLAKLPESPVLDPTFTIVGVVRDVFNNNPREPVEPALFVPTTVTPWGGRLFMVRTSGEAGTMVRSVREALQAVDRSVPVDGAIALDELFAQMSAQPVFVTLILATFAAVGLLLVGVGVYGVLAYAVSRRTQEIAIRMALGADRPLVLGGILQSGAVLLAAGIAVGLLASVGTNRLLGDFVANLSDISIYDPLTMAAAAVTILVTGLAASFLPALRAARVEPMEALRHE